MPIFEYVVFPWIRQNRAVILQRAIWEHPISIQTSSMQLGQVRLSPTIVRAQLSARKIYIEGPCDHWLRSTRRSAEKSKALEIVNENMPAKDILSANVYLEEELVGCILPPYLYLAAASFLLSLLCCCRCRLNACSHHRYCPPAASLSLTILGWSQNGAPSHLDSVRVSVYWRGSGGTSFAAHCHSVTEL